MRRKERKSGRATFFIYHLPTVPPPSPSLYPPPPPPLCLALLPQIYPKAAPVFPLPLLPPATPSPENPRPPLGYTVPGDEHDVEVIEEYKEGPLHRPVHAVAKEKRQSHQIDAKAEPKP